MFLVPASPSAEVSYLSKEETERFFAAIPEDQPRDLLLFDVIYRHGLRRREATLLRRSHLSDGGIWVSRLKGSVSGQYPIHPTTRRRIWTYLHSRGDDGRPHLFVSRQSGDGPLSSSTIYLLFRRYAEAAGIPAERCHPHVLRHSIAVHLMNDGWDVADVQDWLGHRDITSTMVYATVTNKRRQANFERLLRSTETANI